MRFYWWNRLCYQVFNCKILIWKTHFSLTTKPRTFDKQHGTAQKIQRGFATSRVVLCLFPTLTYTSWHMKDYITSNRLSGSWKIRFSIFIFWGHFCILRNKMLCPEDRRPLPGGAVHFLSPPLVPPPDPPSRSPPPGPLRFFLPAGGGGVQISGIRIPSGRGKGRG